MRDCLCWCQDIAQENAVEEKYYERAKHLITEHKVRGFYIPAEVMQKREYEFLITVLNDLKMKCNFDIVIFSPNMTELKKAWDFYISNYFNYDRPRLDFEIHELVDVYISCVYRFEEDETSSIKEYSII